MFNLSKDDKKKIEKIDQATEGLKTRLLKLETDVKKRTSDYERDAKQASKKASEYRNRSKETNQEIDKISEDVKAKQSQIARTKDQVNQILEDAKNSKSEIDLSNSEINKSLQEVFTLKDSLSDKIAKINTVAQEHPNLSKEIDDLEINLSSAEESSNKIDIIKQSITERKKEIDKIFYEIVGFEEETENGGKQHIQGIKDKLLEEYNNLEMNIDELSEKYDEHFGQQKKLITSYVENWDATYEHLLSKIESLLPTALTAGLSSAYSAKKTEEEGNYNKLNLSFGIGIIGMIVVSLLAITASLFMIGQGKTLVEIIDLLPKIASAMLPLYIPVVWYTYSTNKKQNLSKRLIEEYTHKETLAMTFEGLSVQISKIEDEEQSEELRLRLLHNILSVSSENPGKLISDYKKSDHPLLEFIDMNKRTDEAAKRLNRIPGVDKLRSVIGKSKEAIANPNSKNLTNAASGAYDLADEVVKSEAVK